MNAARKETRRERNAVLIWLSGAGWMRPASTVWPPLVSPFRRQAQCWVTAQTRLFCSAAVNDLPDASTLVVGDVNGAVRALREGRRSVLRLIAGIRADWAADESVGEDLEFGWVGRLASGERNEDDLVSALRAGRAIPRAVEGDESTALVLRGELRARVEHQAIGRPVRRKPGLRRLLAGAISHGFAVTAVLRSEDERVLLYAVEVAVRPAVITALFD